MKYSSTMRRNIAAASLFVVFSHFCPTGLFAQQPAKIYLIGTVHDSSSVLNPQGLYHILEAIGPDVLLQENDSEQIANYAKVIRPRSNEQTATLMYLEKHPETHNLPFEFEGRNQYRKDHGMVPTADLAIALIDSLYEANLLNAENRKIYEAYQEANRALMAFTRYDIAAFNSITFETLNRHRQAIQHHELPRITDSEDAFANRYVIKPNGERITYREGFRLWCNFWDLRNNSMAINIIAQANAHPGSTIVVLTGVQHKYYLKELLKKYHDGSYELIEYFQTVNQSP